MFRKEPLSGSELVSTFLLSSVVFFTIEIEKWSKRLNTRQGKKSEEGWRD